MKINIVFILYHFVNTYEYFIPFIFLIPPFNFMKYIYVRKSIAKAINIQQVATYGDFRSPIRAHFQKVPKSLKQNI